MVVDLRESRPHRGDCNVSSTDVFPLLGVLHPQFWIAASDLCLSLDAKRDFSTPVFHQLRPKVTDDLARVVVRPQRLHERMSLV